jgi:hypothetical protein
VPAAIKIRPASNFPDFGGKDVCWLSIVNSFYCIEATRRQVSTHRWPA